MKTTYYIRYTDLDNPGSESKLISAQFSDYPMLWEIEEAIKLVDPESSKKRIGIELITKTL